MYQDLRRDQRARRALFTCYRQRGEALCDRRANLEAIAVVCGPQSNWKYIEGLSRLIHWELTLAEVNYNALQLQF